MRTRLACLSLTLAAGLVLSACAAPASQAEPTATPEPAPTATPGPSPTPAPDPTAAPVPSYTPVSLDAWLAGMPENAPSFSYAPGKLNLYEDVNWPETVRLKIYYWPGTLEEAAQTYDVPWETFQAMNPDPEKSDFSDGYYTLCLDEAYVLPEIEMQDVTIETPWVAFTRTETVDTYTVPAALDEQAAAAMAAAYDFLYEHYGMHIGIDPSEYQDEEGYYISSDGALYTRYTDLEQYLGNIFPADWCGEMLSGPLPTDGSWEFGTYYQGPDDSIVFGMSDRGGDISHCGTVYTQPELQPDGSLLFWQLSLHIESEDFQGWGQDIVYTPDTAYVSPVRLIPTETGWRVAELSLPA